MTDGTTPAEAGTTPDGSEILQSEQLPPDSTSAESALPDQSKAEAGERRPDSLTPPAQDPRAEWDGRLGNLENELALLRQRFEEKILSDHVHENTINKLHKELQEYKGNLVLRLVKPFALDVIKLHDDLGKLAAALGGPGESPEATAALRLYRAFQDDLEGVLERNGFEAFSNLESAFDGRRQNVLRTVPTEDAGRDRQVAERVRKGFLYEGQVVRPEIVNVYVHRPAATP